jgi:hypothetical protein
MTAQVLLRGAHERRGRSGALHKQHGVPGAQKVLGRGRAAHARAEIVDEAYAVALEWHGRAARSDDDHAAVR